MTIQMTSPILDHKIQQKAQSYRDKIDDIMETFGDLLADNRKDALRSTVMSLKKLMVKHWQQMAEADVEVVMKLIHDPSCIYLCQHLTTEGIDVMELVTEVPEGWTFIRQLPEKVQKTEVQELIVTCFDHLSEAHTHMSCHLWPTCHPWPRSLTLRPLTWS